AGKSSSSWRPPRAVRRLRPAPSAWRGPRSPPRADGCRAWIGPATETTAGRRSLGRTSNRTPATSPRFRTIRNRPDGPRKRHAGLKPDIFRPYVGWTKYFGASGLVQPWDPKLITNFRYLNPFMVKAGQYKGKQYGIPADWGFDKILYRSDKVKPKAKSWGL